MVLTGLVPRRAATLRAVATLAVCLCLSLPNPPATAQVTAGTPATAVSDSSVGYSSATSVAFFVLGTALSVYSHETGHWLTAHLTGATSARLTLFPPGMQAQFPAGASTFRRTSPTLAGPLTTRLLAEGIDHVLNTTSPSRTVEALGGATYLAMRVDLPFQVLQSTVRQFFPGADSAHDDIAAGFVLPYFRTRSARNLVYSTLLAAEFIDLWLDAGEIAANWRRLTGRPRTARGPAPVGLQVKSDPSTQSMAIQFYARF